VSFSNSNEATDVDVSTTFNYAAFDALPEEIREEILQAAIEYAAKLGCVVSQQTFVLSHFLNCLPGVRTQHSVN
jgi:hypothetical protein